MSALVVFGVAASAVACDAARAPRLPRGADAAQALAPSSPDRPPERPQGPDASWITTASCTPCHASGTPLQAPWDAAAVYPDLIAAPPLARGAVADRPGLSAQLPVDVTVPEWEVWQALLPGTHERKGDNCMSCHLADAPVEPAPRLAPKLPPVGEVDPRVEGFHAWLHTPEGALQETFGVWVDADTYRTVVTFTVKVLNYGAGHRAPAAPGTHVVLLVDAVDADGKPLQLIKGPTLDLGALPDALRGRPGLLYARVYHGADGAPQLSPDGAVEVASDTRLQGAEHDELHFNFLMPAEAPDEAVPWRARVRLMRRGALGEPGEGVLLEERVAEGPRRDP